MARGTERDLTEKLTETLMWVDLRTTLSACLRKRADEGDQEAIRMLNVMSAFWPFQVPRQQEFANEVQTNKNLSDLLMRALEVLHAHGLDVGGMIAEAISYGAQVPQHLLESKP